MRIFILITFFLLETQASLILKINRQITSYIEIKNKNLIRQKFDYSCGSASLATILKYFYGINITEKDILKKILGIKGYNSQNKEVRLRKEDEGLSFFDLSNYVKTQGFKALGLALNLQTLFNIKIPVILYLKINNNEHFTVYKNKDKHFIYLSDPSFGNIKIRISKFKTMFYQRTNMKNKGKILAILPLDKNIHKINKSFMNIPLKSKTIYNSINL